MSNGSSFVSVGLAEVLFIVFLVLKLTGNVDWAWCWVTSPLWVPYSFLVVLWIIYGFLSAISNKK